MHERTWGAPVPSLSAAPRPPVLPQPASPHPPWARTPLRPPRGPLPHLQPTGTLGLLEEGCLGNHKFPIEAKKFLLWFARENDRGEPAQRVATATGVFKSNLVGLSVGRLASASQTDGAPSPGSPAYAEPSCMVRGTPRLRGAHCFSQMIWLPAGQPPGGPAPRGWRVCPPASPCWLRFLSSPYSPATLPLVQLVLCPLGKQGVALSRWGALGGDKRAPPAVAEWERRRPAGSERKLPLRRRQGDWEGIGRFGFLGDSLSPCRVPSQHLGKLGLGWLRRSRSPNHPGQRPPCFALCPASLLRPVP